MAVIQNNDFQNYMKTGGAFFSIKEGESASVRFLYGRYEEIPGYAVHSFYQDNKSIMIDCPRQNGDPLDNCKWCAKGNPIAARVVFALFNEDTKQVEYWTRTLSWMEKNFKPLVEELCIGKPISGQIFKIKRMGNGRDTTYTFIPIGGNDGKLPTEFPETEDPYSLGVIKEADFEFTPAPEQSAQAAGFNNAQPQRRTTSVF